MADLDHDQGKTVEALAPSRLSAEQRRALVAAKERLLEKCKGGWRYAFLERNRAFSSRTVNSLAALGLIMKTSSGRMTITNAGREELMRPAPRVQSPAVQPRREARLAKTRAYERQRYAAQAGGRSWKPYADD